MNPNPKPLTPLQDLLLHIVGQRHPDPMPLAEAKAEFVALLDEHKGDAVAALAAFKKRRWQ